MVHKYFPLYCWTVLKLSSEQAGAGLVFLARVTDVLHSGSNFSDHIGCGIRESHGRRIPTQLHL